MGRPTKVSGTRSLQRPPRLARGYRLRGGARATKRALPVGLPLSAGVAPDMPGKPSIAYLITSHTLPRQLLRLASVLRRGSPDSEIVIHHDSRTSEVDPSAVEALGARLIEPPSSVDWGRISHLTLMLRCFSWLLEHTRFDWMVLLSGQDYPIRPLADIEQGLVAPGVHGFIETQPCARPRRQDPVDEFALRYHFQWRRIPPWAAGRVVQAAASRSGLFRVRSVPRSGSWLGVRPSWSPFTGTFVCHRGSDWFNLSRQAVSVVEQFRLEHPEVLAYYRRTLSPTESFVQTVLANDRSLRLSGDYSRYTIWDQPHMTGPRVLRSTDLDTLLKSGMDFARKFDETVDRAVLDALDRDVHGL